jgi:glycerol-3-phosphate dehydrogenase
VAPTSDKKPSDKPLPEFSFRTREHFWQHLKNFPDMVANVVIIGGGVVGAGLARELSLQDIPLVFLFEKNDFASATSGASSKLIHAGIRYLELVWNALKKGRLPTALQNFKFVFDASCERKILGKLAPHLIKPKPIYLILGEKDNRYPLSVLAGVWLYYLIQLFQGQFFPPPKIVLRKSAIKWIAPELDASQVKAIFSFWDSETDDARLVMENLQCAHESGSYALNYVKVTDYTQDGDTVVVKLKNNENGQTLSLRTKILINAGGPFVDDMRHSPTKLIDRVAGSHINVYPALTAESYYVTAGDGRLVFVLKRDEDGLQYTRIGTTERPLESGESADNVQATKKEIDYLTALVHEFFPAANINPDTIISTDAGIRPLRAQNEADAFHKSREHDIVVENNVYHVVGVKLTDFRRVANELLLKIPWEKLNLRLSDPHRSESIPLRSQEAARLYVEQDIVEMIRRTMVLHWSDYVARRRGMGPRVLKRINAEAFQREFDAMKDVMGWDQERATREWNAVR